MRYAVYRVGWCEGFRALNFQPQPPKSAPLFVFDGASKLAEWPPRAVYFPQPYRKPFDIYMFWGSALVVTEKARIMLQPFFDTGRYELLPLELGDERYTVVNVLEVIDCLDRRSTVFDASGAITNPAFDPAAISTSLFKIPEMVRSTLFVMTDAARPEWSFKYWIEKFDLQGIRFRPVWEGDAAGQGRIVKPGPAGPVLAVPRELRVIDAGPHGVTLRWLAPASARCCFIGWSHDGTNFYWLFSATPPEDAAAGLSADQWVEYTWRDETPKSGITYYRVLADGHAARTRSDPTAPVTVSIPAPADGDLAQD